MRYLVFAFDQYYPEGGAHDLRFVTDNETEARHSWVRWSQTCDWAHVYDTVEQRIIYGD